MNTLRDIIQADEDFDENVAMDANYQANMFTIEEALRESGAIKPGFTPTKSPYDADLMRLINSVPVAR